MACYIILFKQINLQYFFIQGDLILLLIDFQPFYCKNSYIITILLQKDKYRSVSLDNNCKYMRHNNIQAIDLIDQQDINQSLIDKQNINNNLQQNLLGQNNKKDEPSHVNNFVQSAATSQTQLKVKNNYLGRNRILEGKNIFSKVLFSWIGPFLSYGNLFDINEQNIPILPQCKKPKIEFTRFNQILKDQKGDHQQGMILVKSIAKTYSKDFLYLFIQTFFFITLTMYLPIMTHQIISYVQEEYDKRQLSRGILLFIGVYFITFFKIIAQSQIYYKFGIIGFNLSNTLSLLIYSKSLKHPVLCLKKYSLSQIINYSQVDSQRMTYMGFQLASLLFTPFQVIFGLWLMYSYIGVSFLSGVSVMIGTIALTFIFSKKTIKANQSVLNAKDQRMKTTEQIFSIIKFIKINAFEKYFWKKLNDKREVQLNLNKRKLMYEILTIFVYWLANPLILSVTFTTYTWLGNDMSASQAFTTVMLFRILQYPMKFLPSAISEIIQIWTSIKRVQNYLLAEQITHERIRQSNEQSNKIAIKIKNGTYAWGRQVKRQVAPEQVKTKRKTSLKFIQQVDHDIDKESLDCRITSEDRLDFSPTSTRQSILSSSNNQSQPKFIKALKQINFQIEVGTFTMIIGDIGSGKSSMLFAILNEMKASQTSMIHINGSIAYVSQKPWIMSASLKDNITFTRSFDQQRFSDSVKYASMQTDIGLLVNGQNTQLGEKGTNLSGGQKARIGLARALYSNQDIYLLDDIVSSVDAHVADFIIKNTIRKYLKNKTIVMSTHAVKFAEYADQIIIMKKGQIIKQGSYDQIKQSSQFKQISVNLGKKQKPKQSVQKKNQRKVIQDLEKLKKSFLDKYPSQTDEQHETQKVVQQLIMPQQHTKGNLSLQTYKDYIRLNGGWKLLLIVCGSMSAWLILIMASNIWMQRWCEDPTQGNQFLYIFLILSISSSLFMLIRAYTLIIGGIKCGRTTHRQITKALMYASLNKFFNRIPLGRIINRLSKDLRQIDESIGYSVGSFLSSFFGLIGTLIICVYASSYFLLIPMSLVVYFCNKLRLYYMKTQRQCVRLQNITSSPIVSGFINAVNGLETIRAYKLETEFLSMQIERVDKNKRLRISKAALQSWFCQRLAFITFFVNMTAIAYCMFSQNQNASFAGLLLTYALTLADDIIDTIFSFTNLQSKMISIQRVSNFIKIQPEDGYRQYIQNWTAQQQGYQNAIKNGSIQFIDTKVKYRDQLPPVLKDISFKISKGQKIGIVGRTGAGKTTVISCLLGIIDNCAGKILIDGKQIKQYFLKNLRSSITMIDQQPTLINGTFKQNLDPLNMYTNQQLNRTIEQCKLSEIVIQKGGLQGKITNDNMSVGQKQLICICRAFLKNSSIVLVDEATANIDQKNDNLIQNVIKTKFKQSTVLTIAHRLSTLTSCDKILVLGQGKVLQFGSPQQLMNIKNGIYKHMCAKTNSSNEFLS